jgi:hypothetical protein
VTAANAGFELHEYAFERHWLAFQGINFIEDAFSLPRVVCNVG